jgi:hypothetical protein
MRQSRTAQFTDCAVYPVLVAVMILVIGDTASAIGRLIALALALGAACLWTLVTCRLERILLHGDTHSAEGRDQLDAGARAWPGSLAWLRATSLVFGALLLETLGASLALSLSISGGLVAGFLCYGVVRRAIGRERPQLATLTIAGAVKHQLKHQPAEGIGQLVGGK